RGNDILAGTVDIVVCDTLSGNAFIKMLAGYGSGGMLEVSGSGYGPGIGGDVPLINIISRASGASVVASSIIYSARMAAADISNVYNNELKAAVAAGYRTASADVDESTSSDLKRKTVDEEIEGIDVLQLEDAVAMLKQNGIYCEAGMGCTGPVVMLAAEDAVSAVGLLKKNKILGED
ncbi:MAG TPA: glycine reductase, partial [Spirochaeta sp.]|nr:glycine reductase [Spirochaeta sp.]